jgi:hypothetical protein
MQPMGAGWMHVGHMIDFDMAKKLNPQYFKWKALVCLVAGRNNKYTAQGPRKITLLSPIRLEIWNFDDDSQNRVLAKHWRVTSMCTAVR